MRIDAVLLAAGNSVRFGGNKLLTPFHGSPLYRYTFDAVNAAGCFAQVVVVTQYEEIAAAAAAYGYACVHNEHPELGQSHSVALGTAAALEADAILFAVCDQPYLRPESLRRLAEQADPFHILRSQYGEQKGSPTLFPRRYFEELLSLSGDVGGRAVMKRHPDWVRDIAVSEAKELFDVDTRIDG